MIRNILKMNNWVLLLLLLSNSILHAQDSSIKALKFGDTAPELRVNWIKGEPVKKYEPNKIYIIEFWATWCGPCRSAMPHLTEIAKQYEDKIIVIGVNVWEDHGKGKEPIETLLPRVKKTVKSIGDQMDYRVAMDKNELYMAKNWMEAAGIVGIPHTFMIKDKKIIWMGHPSKLDEVLDMVLNETYDINIASKDYYNSKEKENNEMEVLINLQKKVMQAISDKKYSEAISMIDSAKVNDNLIFSFYMLRFMTYIEYDVPLALSFAEEKTKEDPQMGKGFAGAIVEKDELPKEAYQFAIDQLMLLLEGNGIKPIIYEYVASCYNKMHDKNHAVATQKMAIEFAEDAIKSGEYKGIVTSETLKRYQEVLKEYETNDF